MHNHLDAIVDRGAAEALIGSLFGLMDELRETLETETALIGAGRTQDGLAGEVRKTELGQAYIRHLQAAKSNVVALKRHAPDRLQDFRQSQVEFERVLERNQAVIATAKAVSESLVKGVAEELERRRRPVSYTSTGAGASAAPLVFSRRY